MKKGNLIGQGRTAEIFTYGELDILKLYRKDMPKAAIESEYEISKLVYEQGVSTPCPKEMVQVDGRFGIVYERIHGKSMMSIIGSKPWRIKSEARRLADLHYAVHNCTADGLPNQKSRLKDSINHTDMLTENKKSQISLYLDSLEDGNTLCHGDFHPDNILLSSDKTSIIDWMTGTTGNPLADVARTCIMLSTGELPPGTPGAIKLMIRFVRKLFYSEYIKRYLIISGLPMEEIEKWILPIAAARLSEWLPQSEKQQLLKIVDDKLKNPSKQLSCL